MFASRPAARGEARGALGPGWCMEVWSGNRTRDSRILGPMLYPTELSMWSAYGTRTRDLRTMRSDALASEPMPSLRNPLQPARGIRHGSAARTGRAWEPVPLRTGERGFALPPVHGGNSCRPLWPAAGLLLLSRLALGLELPVLIANPEANTRLASCTLGPRQSAESSPSPLEGEGLGRGGAGSRKPSLPSSKPHALASFKRI